MAPASKGCHLPPPSPPSPSVFQMLGQVLGSTEEWVVVSALSLVRWSAETSNCGRMTCRLVFICYGNQRS